MAPGPRWILSAILLLALVLRACGLTFGLDRNDPHQTQFSLKDERGMVNEVREALETGSLHPGSFLYRGPGSFLLYFVVDAALVGLQTLAGDRPWQGVLVDLKSNPSDLYLVHRWLTVLTALGTVALVWRFVRRTFDAASALCAALFLATAYVHVRESHFGLSDTLWAFLTLLAVERASALIHEPSTRAYCLAGLCAGTAMAVKYFSGLLGLVLFVAHLIARAKARRAGRELPPHARLVLAWGFMPFAFLLVSPGLFVAFSDMLARMQQAADVYGPSSDPLVLARGLFVQARDTFGVGLGEPVLVLALLGLGLTWRRGPSGRFTVLALLLMLPSILLTIHHPTRFGMALLVLLVVPAGVACAALLARVPRWVAFAVVPLVVAPSLVRSVFFGRLLQRQDTRIEMLAALRQLDVPRDEVLAIGWHHGLPSPVNPNLKPYRRPRPDKDERDQVLDELRGNPPRYVLRDYTMPESETVTELEQSLLTGYREIRRLDGRKPGDPLILPDPRGGDPDLMVPFARPWAMLRPGPPLALFEREPVK